MGSVWLAHDQSLDSRCAVKLVDPEKAANEEVRMRFEREARAAAQIRGANVVDIFDHGVWNGTPFIVMEYLEGEDLGARLERMGQLDCEQTYQIISQVARALVRAHAAGIVHRDLKPENIFLARQGGQEFPKVLDFGLAKVTERQMQPGSLILTQEGMVFGTPEFMSPEQAQGKTLDARSDIYSLAVILYEVLTGKLPFSAKSPMEYIQKHVTEPIIALSERVADKRFPPELDAVLARALAKKPEQRFQTAAEFAEALRPFGGASGPPVSLRPDLAPRAPEAQNGLPPRAEPSAKSTGPGLLVGVAALCLVAGVLLAVVVMRLMGR
jgi:eukaryotic-like serine/threonine-protein kinase